MQLPIAARELHNARNIHLLQRAFIRKSMLHFCRCVCVCCSKAPKLQKVAYEGPFAALQVFADTHAIPRNVISIIAKLLQIYYISYKITAKLLQMLQNTKESYKKH